MTYVKSVLPSAWRARYSGVFDAADKEEVS